jgi:chaperone modulatory protein CbpM
MSHQEIHSIEILDGSITLLEMIESTRIERTLVIEMVDAGLVDPSGDAIEQWQFALSDLRRVRTAQRLVNDLGVNLSGAALILDLIEERDALLARASLLQRMVDGV